MQKAENLSRDFQRHFRDMERCVHSYLAADNEARPVSPSSHTCVSLSIQVWGTKCCSSEVEIGVLSDLQLQSLIYTFTVNNSKSQLTILFYSMKVSWWFFY